MKHLSRFNENWNFVNQRNINIDEFEDEIPDYTEIFRKTTELTVKHLSTYSSIAGANLYSTTKPWYTFNKKIGGFGDMKGKFSGTIHWRGNYNGEKFFIIVGVLEVSMGTDKGKRSIYIKKDTIDEVISFMDGFEKALEEKISIG